MDGRRSPGGQPTKANADLPTSLAPSGATPTSPGASSSSISIALKASSSTAVSPATAASPMGVGGAVVSPVVSSKILGRNSNGTVVMTSVPANEAELQLYRVMQRASLLAYYDTLLEMGGDDVQQLCEAGEEEFLEIMALVGMASKPLHVRRLQKALQEWFNNPAQFQVPLGPSPAFPVAIPAPRPLVGPGVAATPQATPLAVPSAARSPPLSHTSPGPAALSPAPSLVPERPERPERQEHLSRSTASSPVAVRPALTPPSPADPMQTAMGSIPVPMDFSTASTTTTTTTAGNNHHLNHNHHSHHSHSHYNNNHHHHLHHQPTSPSTSPLQTGPGRPLSAPLSSPTPSSTPMTPRSLSPSLQLTPVLLESQIQRLAEAARNLSRTLPSCQPRPHNTKKKICKDLELVINMSDEDPRRMDEIRKYAAIYGRFDCKRKPEKPLTLHEVSVNEAAAQICRFVPALLTRRDELFPLARQVVRDSGYLYSKGHTNLSCYRPRCPSGDDILTAGHKRARLEPGGSPSPDSSEGDRVERAERAEQLQRRQCEL